ncbi:hypothetical protein HELRODRAFT_194731 [Helobdella robusta]|uniref:RRM domain-containing protein n=1 Tax=Helobdella robusta TaxID=6412 RepID=T1FWC9_HELRO|nr:hypothetical protein HELRODRAFT_194731 [Helobdella robusta]ESN90035.1 hypothetical protein HELRODRAFT_194731 [Helobdella robusta]
MSENRIYIFSVPADFEIILRLFAENERFGGGRLQSFEYDDARQVATVEFVEEAIANQFLEKCEIEILRHKMSVIPVPCESTIFVYDVDEVINEDIDCSLESSRKGGGKLREHIYYEQYKCVKAVFENSENAKAFIERGKIEILKKDFIISNLPPMIYLPQKRVKVVDKVVVLDIKQPDHVKKLGKVVTPPKKKIPYKEAGDSEKMVVNDNRSKIIVKGSGDNDDDDGDDDDDDEKEEDEDDEFENVSFEIFNISDKLDERRLHALLKNRRYGGPLRTFNFDSVNKMALVAFEDVNVSKSFAKNERINITNEIHFDIRKIPSFKSRKQSSSSLSSSSSASPSRGQKSRSKVQHQLSHNNGNIGEGSSSSAIPSMLECKDRSEPGTVEVIGRISAGKLDMYAQNRKRSHGGPVEHVTQISDDVHVVVFKDINDAQSFCTHDHCEFLKLDIQTKLLDSWPVNVLPRAIKVQGFRVETKAEGLKLFFENPRSGGTANSVADVVILQPDVAVVTFKNSEVIKNILSKGDLKLAEKVLKAEVMKPYRPPYLLADDGATIDRNKLMFVNLKQKKLDVEHFKMFISDLACSDVVCLILNDCRDKAIVTFSKEPNYVNLKHTLCAVPYQGVMISMDPLTTIDTVSILKNPELEPCIVKSYLENKRSHGGAIKLFREEKARYIVQFHNPKSAENLLAKPDGHALNGITLTISPHINGFNK